MPHAILIETLRRPNPRQDRPVRRLVSGFGLGCLLLLSGLGLETSNGPGEFAIETARAADPALEAITNEPMQKSETLRELQEAAFKAEGDFTASESVLNRMRDEVDRDLSDEDVVLLYLELGERLGRQGELRDLTSRWVETHGEKAYAYVYHGATDSEFHGATEFAEALELDADSYRAKVGLGQAKLLAGSADDAAAGRALLLEAAREHPNHPAAFEVLAEDYRVSGDLDSYVLALERAATADPWSPVLKQKLLQGLQQLGNQAGQAGSQAWAQRAVGIFDRVGRLGDGDSNFLYIAARLHSSLGDTDQAIESLKAAADHGLADPVSLERDRTLAGLRAHPDMKSVLAKVKENRKTFAPELKAALAEELVSHPLPSGIEFALMDGGTVKLDELKGKVVILDFWATWCGPCRQALPLVRDFFQEKRENVEVYCVNVFERDGGKSVRPFWESQKYPMPLALGSQDHANAFGVSSIPHLFVIGPEGRIRFVHKGYTPYLTEQLGWVSELLMEQAG